MKTRLLFIHERSESLLIFYPASSNSIKSCTCMWMIERSRNLWCPNMILRLQNNYRGVNFLKISFTETWKCAKPLPLSINSVKITRWINFDSSGFWARNVWFGIILFLNYLISSLSVDRLLKETISNYCIEIKCYFSLNNYNFQNLKHPKYLSPPKILVNTENGSYT